MRKEEYDVNERVFDGIWFPRELYLNPDLSWTEKILLIEINSLDKPDRGCYSSSGRFAAFLQKSEGTIDNLISKLKKEGYLSVVYDKFGRKGLRVNGRLWDKNHHENVKKVHKNVRSINENVKNSSRKREQKIKEKKQVKNKEESLRSDFSNLHIWMENFYKDENLKHLPNFEKQPSHNYISKKLTDKNFGAEILKNVLLQIEAHCEKNPGYLQKRSSLSGVITTFLKNSETPTEKKAQQIFSEAFKKQHGEDYKFDELQKKGGLKKLFAKIKDDFLNTKSIIESGVKVDDDFVLLKLSNFLGKLPVHHKEKKFNPSLIAYGYQEIKLEIAAEANKKSRPISNNGRSRDDFKKYYEDGK